MFSEGLLRNGSYKMNNLRMDKFSCERVSNSDDEVSTAPQDLAKEISQIPEELI